MRLIANQNLLRMILGQKREKEIVNFAMESMLLVFGMTPGEQIPMASGCNRWDGWRESGCFAHEKE